MSTSSNDEQNKTLLERAKEAPTGRYLNKPTSDEMTDLAVAFVSGSVSTAQVTAVLGGSRQGAVQRLWTAFRRAVVAGRVTIRDERQAEVAAAPRGEVPMPPVTYDPYSTPGYWNGGR